MAKILAMMGTDTEVGKTYVSCLLMRALDRAGIRVAAFKPLESGCPLVAGVLNPEDSQALGQAGGGRQTIDEINVYRFQEPVAPGIAAALEGVMIDWARINQRLLRLTQQYDLVVLEGAGGLLVPLGGGETWLSWLPTISAEIGVILVGRNRLGTINHTLLSLEALDRRGLQVIGVYLNSLDQEARPGQDLDTAFIEDIGNKPILDIIGRHQTSLTIPSALQDWLNSGSRG
ncbi:MAG: dethiobiotin synthase [Deltaproteobacteria bacterium]|nr:dethiobiotin synthase [Deltaproteobacteria bacterium]